MTQRPLGRGSGIIAAKSYFMLVKWLVPVNRNMTTKAPRPAPLQEESHSTPSKPTPRRMMNEARRTNKDTICLLSERAGDPPSAYAAALLGHLLFGASLTVCLPTGPACQRLVLLGVTAHLLLLSGRSQPYVLILSLHPDAALNHPHFSCTTPALRLQEY